MACRSRFIVTVVACAGAAPLALLVASLLGCDGDGAVTPVLTSLTISPTRVTIEVGQSRLVQVSGYDQNRDAIGFTATWSMEGAAGTITPGGEVGATVATCTFDATAVGSGAVVATADGLTARCTLTVTETGGGGGELTNLFFLHHSTGNGLIEGGDMRGVIDTYNTDNGTAFDFWDHGYNAEGLRDADGAWTGAGYDIPGDNTDPDGLHTLWTTSNAARTAILANHEVIAFKSCFPASAITTPQMLDQYKAWYREMRDFFDTRPDRLFVVMSTPPLHRLATNLSEADRARAFADWLSSDQYLAGHPNVVCFDLFDALAQPDDGSVRRNMLLWDYEGSHSSSDSHPNALANQTVGPAFAYFLIDAAAAYDAP